MGLGGHGTLGNALKECYAQQGAPEKTPSTKPNHNFTMLHK